MGMLSWAFTVAWWGVALVWGTAGFVATAIAWLLALPFRMVMLLYRMVAACLLCSLKLVDIYWRVVVIEKAMLFSWIIYELVFSLSLLILLKAVLFFRRALWACQIFPEGQGWRKLLKSVSPGPDALCSICLEPFSGHAGHSRQASEQQDEQQSVDCDTLSQVSSFADDTSVQTPDSATEDSCTSGSPSISHPTPADAPPPRAPLRHADPRVSYTSATGSMPASSLSRDTLSAASTGSLPLSSLTNPFSTSLSEPSGRLSGYSSPSGISSAFDSDDSSSQPQPYPASRPALSSLLLLPLSWLPRPCQALLLRLLIALRTSGQRPRVGAGVGRRAGGTALGGRPAAGSACQLPCGHAFCRPCVTRWLERHQQTCPLCRRSIHGPKPSSQLARWLASTPGGQRLAAAVQPLAGFARALWSLLMALLLCGPFMYGWYCTVRLVGARLGVYHHLLSQSACVDFVLCLVLFVRVLQRRCTLDPSSAAT